MRKFFRLLVLFFLVPFLHAQTPGGTTINGIGGPFTFTGSGVSCTGYVCTFSGGGSATWGSITGTLSNQTDLQTALSALLPLTGGTLTGGLTIAPTATGVVPLTVNTPTGSTADLQDWGAAGSPKTTYIDQYSQLHISEITSNSALTVVGTGIVKLEAGPNAKVDDFDVFSGWGGTDLSAGTVVAVGTTTHSVVACAVSCTNAIGVVDSNPNSNNYIQTIGSHLVNLDGTYTVTAQEYVCASATTGGEGTPQLTSCPDGEQWGYVTTPATSVTTATVWLQFK